MKVIVQHSTVYRYPDAVQTIVSDSEWNTHVTVAAALDSPLASPVTGARLGAWQSQVGASLNLQVQPGPTA